MATRYWVGGTGTWNTTNTANWSTTSGGAGGASVPNPGDYSTLGDVVIFDNNSGGGTVTYDISTGYWGGLDASLFTGTIALGNRTLGFGVGASNVDVKFGSNCTVTSSSLGSIYVQKGTVNLTANTPMPNIKPSGTLNLLSALTLQTGASIDGAGNLYTNGWSITGTSSGSYIEVGGVCNISSSTITIGGSFYVKTGFTQSSSAMYVGGIIVQANNKTLGAVYYTIGSTNNGATLGGAGYALTVSGLYVSSSGPGGNVFNIRGTSLTVTGMMNIQGYSTLYPMLVNAGNNDGTKTSITRSNGSVQNVIFSNASFTSPYTAMVYVGDQGNNVNLTASTPRTLYSNGGSWHSTSAWSLSAGGATGQNPPLPQDSIVSYTGITDIGNTYQGVYYINNLTLTSGTLRVGNSGTYSLLISLGNVSGTSGELRGADSSNAYFYMYGGRGGSTQTINLPSGILTSQWRMVQVLSYFGPITVSQLNMGSALFGTLQVGVLGSSLTISGDITTAQSGGTPGSREFVIIEYEGYGGTLTLSSTAKVYCGIFTYNQTSTSSSISFNTNASVYFSQGGILNVSNTSSKKLAGKFYFRGTAQLGPTSPANQGNNAWLGWVGENPSGAVTSFKVTSGYTVNLDSWNINGDSTTPVVLDTQSGTGSFTMNYTGVGLVEANYLNIKNSTVTPSSTWYAYDSTNSGNNVGWVFPSKNNVLFFGSNF